MTHRTRIFLGCAAVILALILGLIIGTRRSPPSVAYTDQATVRAAMKWSALKITLHK